MNLVPGNSSRPKFLVGAIQAQIIFLFSFLSLIKQKKLLLFVPKSQFFVGGAIGNNPNELDRTTVLVIFFREMKRLKIWLFWKPQILIEESDHFETEISKSYKRSCGYCKLVILEMTQIGFINHLIKIKGKRVNMRILKDNQKG